MISGIVVPEWERSPGAAGLRPERRQAEEEEEEVEEVETPGWTPGSPRAGRGQPPLGVA